MVAMTLAQGIIWYVFKFIFLVAVALAGIACGIKIRKIKNSKANANSDINKTDNN